MEVWDESDFHVQWSFQESSQIGFIIGGEFEKQEGYNVISVLLEDL